NGSISPVGCPGPRRAGGISWPSPPQRAGRIHQVALPTGIIARRAPILQSTANLRQGHLTISNQVTSLSSNAEPKPDSSTSAPVPTFFPDSRSAIPPQPPDGLGRTVPEKGLWSGLPLCFRAGSSAGGLFPRTRS